MVGKLVEGEERLASLSKFYFSTKSLMKSTMGSVNFKAGLHS